MQALHLAVVARFGQPDRGFGQVVAQDVARVDRLHARAPFGVHAAFGAQALVVADDPGVEAFAVEKQVAHRLRCHGADCADPVVGQQPPGQRVVGLVAGHQAHQVVDQRLVAILFGGQAELGAHALAELAGEGVGIDGERIAQHRADLLLVAVDQRHQRLRQRAQVPVGDLRLARIGVAALFVRVVADVHRIEAVEEAEGAVVDRQAEDGQVVRVHHAVAEPDRLPVRQQARGAARDLGQHRRDGLRRLAAGRVMVVDDKVGQAAQRGVVAIAHVVAEVLEVPEAHEARRDPRDHGGGFRALAAHRQVGRGQRQRAGRGDAERVHRLGTQELADRRAQHGPAVGAPGVGRHAAALELQLARAVRGLDLAEQQRTAVAQLARPDAELVAAVDRRGRVHAGPGGAGAEGVQRAWVLPPVGRPAQVRRCGVADRDPPRVRQRLAGLPVGKRQAHAGVAVAPAQVRRLEGEAVQGLRSVHGGSVASRSRGGGGQGHPGVRR